MFKPGDLVGLMVQDDWLEFQECGKAEVVWTEGHRGTEFFEDLKLIAYGRQND